MGKHKYCDIELPLLQLIQEMGGEAPAKSVYSALADRLGVDESQRTEKIREGSAHRKWDRTVRWVRQNLVAKGLIDAKERGVWSVTKKGEQLVNAPEGFCMTVYEVVNDAGEVIGRAIWGDVHVAQEQLLDGSVNLCITSPPYPLSQPMAYGNPTEKEYLGWFLPIAERIQRKLTPDGSLVLNLAPVWQKGRPTMSLYIHKVVLALCEELGFYLAQENYAINYGKKPSSSWVTVDRIRVKNSVENYLWFSKTPYPKADNRKVLEPYSEKYKAQLTKGGYGVHVRPSGEVMDRFNKDNGGKIPHNLLVGNSVSTDSYIRHCKENGQPLHSARFPQNVVEYWVKLTTQERDHVWDPFSGSNKTGEVCERLNRRFTVGDRALAYLMGGVARLKPINVTMNSLFIE